MSIAVAERLKNELTDRYVVVTKGVPELRRFLGLTGTVKTVNMNGRALVQFDGPEDISWYDIDPSYLVVVDAPLPKTTREPEQKASKSPAKKSAPAAKSAGKSPLELAREQAAGKAATPAATKPPTEKASSPLDQARQQGSAAGTTPPTAKPLSPLELARQQGTAATAPAETAPPDDKPADTQAAAPAVDVSKLSPLERARLEGSSN